MVGDETPLICTGTAGHHQESRMDGDIPTVSVLERVRDVTAMACALPGAATQDWCDRAAACLCAAGERCLAVLAIGSVDPLGLPLVREGLGVAGSAGLSSEIQGLRSRAVRQQNLGWLPQAGLRNAICGPMDRLVPRWRTGPAARLWMVSVEGEILAAACPIGDPGGRVMMVQVFVAGDGGQASVAESVIQATLPLLAARTFAALGPADGETKPWITAREQEILDHLTAGKSVRQIAESLGRSPHTVHDHVKTLHRKLRASTRGELIAKALGHSAVPVVAGRTIGRAGALRSAG
jgi:DNA-binding CsgD family transcriptional regulator